MKPEPVAFIWDGSAMIPLDRFRALARRQFRAGNEYALIPHHGRSKKAHGLYFKCVEVAWQNLPEHWQHRRDSNLERFPTSTHLRKWALVQEGYADEHSIVCASEGQAMNTASLCREINEYAVITLNGQIVTVWTPKSQDEHNMGDDEFQQSMNKVLGRLAHMLDISVDQLTDNAKAAMTRIKESS